MKLNRREFLALSGKSAIGTVIFAACGLPERELIVQSPVEAPEDLVHGGDNWYATTWGDVPGGDGMIVRVFQGRAKKIAGNPDYPVNLGKQSPRFDPALQFLYHPDRLPEPLMRRSKGGTLSAISWAQAERAFQDTVSGAGGRVVVVTNPVRGHLGSVVGRFAEQVGGRHLMFDPNEQGVLHATVKKLFNQDQLPDLDLGRAHTILSFGADWLSTWVSPVRWGVKYGDFRGQQERGYFIHVDTRMSMTAANADLWLAPTPGTEGQLALGIAKIIIDEGLASGDEIAAFSAGMAAGGLDSYTLDSVATATGVPAERIQRAARRFATARPSVAFGGGSAAAHTNGSFNMAAIYALNRLVGAVGAEGGIIMNPGSPLEGVPASATGAPLATWEQELAQWRAGNVDTVIIRGVDLVHGMPNSVAVIDALSHVPNVIAFGHVMDDTLSQADLILPEKVFLETWGTDIPEPAPGYQVVGFQQPVVGATVNIEGTGLLSDSRGFGDMLLTAADLGAASMQEVAEQAATALFDMNRASDSINAPSAAAFLSGVLQRGGWWDTGMRGDQAAPATPDLAAGQAPAEFSSTDGLGEGEDFYLVPFVHNSLLDGRFAATPWAQQTPDPMTSIAWATWAEINTHTAEDLGIREGDVLFIKSTTGAIEALAYPHPGVPPGVIGVPTGYGYQSYGRWAEGRGSNVFNILVDMKDAETGALAWAATRVKVQRAGRRVKIPKFEGELTAFPAEPGVPVLVVAPGQTAHEAEEANHHLYQEQFLDPEGDDAGEADH